MLRPQSSEEAWASISTPRAMCLPRDNVLLLQPRGHLGEIDVRDLGQGLSQQANDLDHCWLGW
jgi:hypothetical protein